MKGLVASVGGCNSDGSKGGGTRGFDPNVCTRPPCFKAKAHAAFRLLSDKAEAEGFGVLDPASAKRLFSGPRGALSPVCEYIDLDSKPTPRHTGHYKEEGLRKWREILKGQDYRTIKAMNPVTNRIHDLVVLEEIENQLEVKREEQGELTSLTGIGQDPEAARLERERRERAERARSKRVRELDHRIEVKAADVVADALVKSGEVLPDEVLSLMFKTLLNSSADGCSWLAKWTDCPKPSPGATGREFIPELLQYFDSPVRTRIEKETYLVMAALAPGMKNQGVGFADFQQLAGVLKVDLKKEESALRKEDDKAVAEEGKKEAKAQRELEKLISDAFPRLAGHPAETRITSENLESLAKVPKAKAKAVFEEMVMSGIIAGGKLNRESSPVSELLASGKVKAAEVVPLDGSAPVSLLGPDSKDVKLSESQLVSLEAIIWGNQLTAIDLDFFSCVTSITDRAERLFAELVTRGVIDDNGTVQPLPEGWRKDSVAVRRADEYFDRANAGGGAAVTLEMAEDRFGLKAGQLRNYRSNKRLKERRAAAKGKGGAEA